MPVVVIVAIAAAGAGSARSRTARNRENQFPFSFCGQRSAPKTKQMNDWRAGHAAGLRPGGQWAVLATLFLHGQRTDKLTQRETGRKRQWEREGGRENQEMRLTFEQWARKGNEVLCGGPHVAPTRGRSTRRMLNLNEVPTLLIAPLPLPQSFSWFTAFNDAVYFAFDAPKEKN